MILRSVIKYSSKDLKLWANFNWKKFQVLLNAFQTSFEGSKQRNKVPRTHQILNIFGRRYTPSSHLFAPHCAGRASRVCLLPERDACTDDDIDGLVGVRLFCYGRLGARKLQLERWSLLTLVNYYNFRKLFYQVPVYS